MRVLTLHTCGSYLHWKTASMKMQTISLYAPKWEVLRKKLGNKEGRHKSIYMDNSL